MMHERGKSIVIEGNYGTGKSTQVELLATWLRDAYGIESLTIHEPDGPTEKCKQLRAKIKDGSLPRTPLENLQWFTESREESNRYAREHFIDRGKWVLRARNWRSTEAYQGGGEGLSTELIRETTEAHTDELYMHPDLEVILYLDNDARRQRIGDRGALETPDTFEMRDNSFQDRVNQRYIEIGTRDNLPLIEASPSVEDIQQKIRELLYIRGLLTPISDR